MVKGTIDDDTPHAPYTGFEILREFPAAKPEGFKSLKKDRTGSGTGKSQRSENRLIVLVDVAGQRVEEQAWL